MAILSSKPTLPATLLADGQRYMVEPEGLSIGRGADTQVVVDSNWASRHHAQVHQEGESWVVTDLGSRNGTQLNGHRFHDASRELRDGDAITVAGLSLRFLTEGG